jgi:tetratricopeptide (TPR) repeat protein
MNLLRIREKSSQQLLLISLVLAAITLTLFWPTQHFGFIEFDDDIYVARNPYVATGLSKESMTWAFRNLDAGFWHPLTWLSHLLDVEIYQFNAGGHHWTNVQIHLASTLLLFILLSVMTGAYWASALAAALFAIHPLHVESVVWIAERKDVLCGFFWILTIGFYLFYVKNPNLKRYFLILASFVLGLLSKPMIVTLPLVLLLLDLWPLKRFHCALTLFDGIFPSKGSGNRSAWLRLLAEKTPLLVLSAASAGLAIVAQANNGALSSFESIPLEARLANAPVSCVAYLGKMFWPVNLSVFYPHPGIQPLWKVSGSILILASVSALAVRMRRQHPYVLVGWFWYLITLLPVIQLVQVGTHAMADRYTYIPLIGPFMIIAWSLKSIYARWHQAKTWIITLTCSCIFVSFVLSSIQVGYWRDYKTLFLHASEVTERNELAYNNLGIVYARQGRADEAASYFKKAVEAKNDYRDAWVNLGVTYIIMHRYNDAAECFQSAIVIDPVTAKNRINLAIALKYAGHAQASADELLIVLKRDPNNVEALFHLGIIRLEQGKLAEAESYLREVLRMNPRNADALNNLGLVRMEQEKTEEAIACFLEAREFAPGNVVIETNLKIAYEKRKKGALGRGAI